MRTSNYSDYLTAVSALIGVDQSDFATTELTFLNAFFNKAIRDIWERNSWTDLSPYGEVRFPVNLIGYPNDLTQSTWSLTAATATASSTANPLDNRTTASNLLETADTSAHSFSQSFTALPSTNYSASGYVRPNGRSYIQVALNDGVSSYSAFFNFNNPGSVGTTSGTLGSTGIQLQANGFYYWSLCATSASSATGTGTLTVSLSPDGVTSSYAGSSNLGIWSWGTTLCTPNSTIPAAYYIPWEQNGEAAIDVLYEAWTTDPGSFLPPYRADYNLTPNGIELIGPTSTGPVYLYYRTRRPLFTGPTYSSSTSYSAGNTFYYTSTAFGTPANYYTVISSTTTGQNPDTNASLFSVITIPYIFFEYCVYSAYADWLEVEGQSMKASSMRDTAQTYLDNEMDRLERQQGAIQPWKVYTHLTSQNRGLGYVGQNFNAGTATIN